ncbi:MAG: class I SAM-dependent methyltransferase [Planctomycetota bacterium]|nr:class I SAM-dependent methyltransferase [Planctomycetota bacterium]MDA1214478.1 class I SAM-dependent methyltransferase [Planctomycetota bacterium]
MTSPVTFLCPTCGLVMNDERVAGLLWCPRCALSINFREGIPRFVESAHLESFGLQWNRYEVAHADEDRATFQAKTGFSLDELAGKLVLDAGCGGGRYSKIVGGAGGIVVGADHTHAVDKAANLCADLEQVSFVQADLKKLPFPPASFDYAFSIGVMHHDVNTRAVFDTVAKMVKPGGKLAVWLYRKNQFWQEWLNTAIRKRTMNMPPEKLERWCRIGAFLGGVPIMKQTLNKIVNFSNHPNYENRVCDTFDWFAPQYQHHHTVDELFEWYREAGYENLVVLPPEKRGTFYRWTYEKNLLIGSGVNVMGTRKS